MLKRIHRVPPVPSTRSTFTCVDSTDVAPLHLAARCGAPAREHTAAALSASFRPPGPLPPARKKPARAPRAMHRRHAKPSIDSFRLRASDPPTTSPSRFPRHQQPHVNRTWASLTAIVGRPAALAIDDRPSFHAFPETSVACVRRRAGSPHAESEAPSATNLRSCTASQRPATCCRLCTALPREAAATRAREPSRAEWLLLPRRAFRERAEPLPRGHACSNSDA